MIGSTVHLIDLSHEAMAPKWNEGKTRLSTTSGSRVFPARGLSVSVESKKDVRLYVAPTAWLMITVFLAAASSVTSI